MPHGTAFKHHLPSADRDDRRVHRRIDLGQRRSHDIVERAAKLAQFLDVVQLADLEESPVYGRPRDMPRERTLKPVALATMLCSKLILEPSAKLVTIAAFCPQRSAKPCCVVGLR
jgi:hypothetical protein